MPAFHDADRFIEGNKPHAASFTSVRLTVINNKDGFSRPFGHAYSDPGAACHTINPLTTIVWFRRDLRLHDLPALTQALALGPVAPLFVLDPRLVNGRWPSSNRTAFMLACLRELDAGLRQRGNQLNIRVGHPKGEVPKFARETGASEVFISRDYSPYARRRDAAVKRALDADGVRLHARPGTLVHEPEDILTGSGEPYSVFTPFFRRWLQQPQREIEHAPEHVPGPADPTSGIPAIEDLGVRSPTARFIEPGEAAALGRLSRWVNGGIEVYTESRDDLAGDRTSRLSQDLKWGSLSPLQVVSAASGHGDSSAKFISEVAWRDFYHHVLWHNPRVLKESFQRQFSHLTWDDAGMRFERWKTGNTGYPVVDAAMRQLSATGYMHNRGRMIVASFLTKDLHIDWRLGEAHFMEHLVDGDVANNNGGWQWAASTGADPQPYFRIFNPLLQSRRFDPDGAYIRRWVPDLRNVPTAFIHEPAKMSPLDQNAAGCVIGRDYPAPIVDHTLERPRALALYSEARGGATRSG
jgi:deoxyribodipyrimidine photo-lyase